ncbi:hypothetical protein CEXT_563691 [Caerostris extrusa]|uniref:Uncharacterized protein n=1 Tax=Caerostris extrusa TaxID=172846 RepID=A0AAV4T8W0_CAEEX|nr:hypothetical protein CEXT_563691 [Caerostris extrusa]
MLLGSEESVPSRTIHRRTIFNRKIEKTATSATAKQSSNFLKQVLFPFYPFFPILCQSQSFQFEQIGSLNPGRRSLSRFPPAPLFFGVVKSSGRKRTSSEREVVIAEDKNARGGGFIIRRFR